MIKTKTNLEITNVRYINNWNGLSFTLEDDSEVTIRLSDEQWDDLTYKVTSGNKSRKERKLEKLQEELEKLNAADDS